MIIEIQNKLQKHNKIVFTILLAIIIVAFVFTIGNMPGIGGGERQTVRTDYFGYNLQSERDVREIMRFGGISFRIERGEQQVSSNQLQNYVFERIAYQNLADTLKIPSPTPEQLQHFLRSRPAFQNSEGIFDFAQYSSFIDQIEADPEISTGDVAWVLEQDYRINEARKLLEGPGFVLPTEVRLQLERNQELWTIDLASLDLNSFEPEIEVTEENLEEFFAENSFRYEREPRVVFSYAFFDRDDFVNAVPPLTENEIATYFEQNRAQFTPEPTPKAETDDETEAEEPKEVTLADVRDQVETALRKQKAIRVAGLSASDFAYALFQSGLRPGSEDFEELLSNYKGELRDAPPASRSEFPPNLGFSYEAREAVFRLDEDRDFSDPVRIGDNYAVLIYKETLPSYVPQMEEVKAEVEQDYRTEERRRLIAEHGREIHDSIVAKMSDEEISFIEAAESEGLSVQSPEPFTRIAPPSEINRQLIMRLDDFEMHEVSQMIQIQNSGYFVFVKDRSTPAVDTDSEEFTNMMENLRQFSSMGGTFALQEYVSKEMAASHNH